MGTSLMWQTDLQLREAVERQLAEDAVPDAASIAPIVSDGVLVLTGFACGESSRSAAEESARRVRGVRAVVNDIRVTTPDARTDADIAREAAHALRNQTSVFEQVIVTVRDGTVALDGTVEWMHQKAAAESVVAHVKGVKEVLNRVLIGPVASARDISFNIEEAMRRGAASAAGHVVVDVDDGTVKLSGSVHSWAEREEAERAAWSTPGVAHVENGIRVEP